MGGCCPRRTVIASNVAFGALLALSSSRAISIPVTLVSALTFNLCTFWQSWSHKWADIWGAQEDPLRHALRAPHSRAVFAERRRQRGPGAHCPHHGRRTRSEPSTTREQPVDLNPAAARVLGYGPEEVIGRNVTR